MEFIIIASYILLLVIALFTVIALYLTMKDSNDALVELEAIRNYFASNCESYPTKVKQQKPLRTKIKRFITFSIYIIAILTLLATGVMSLWVIDLPSQNEDNYNKELFSLIGQSITILGLGFTFAQAFARERENWKKEDNYYR